jgi:hypothetical protein
MQGCSARVLKICSGGPFGRIFLPVSGVDATTDIEISSS